VSDTFCAKCGAQYRDGDVFCAKCGVRRDGEGGGERASSAPSTPSAKSAAWIGLTLVGVGALTFVVFGDAGEHLKGHVVVTGGPHRAFTFTPTGCVSMQPRGHYGANLHGDGPNDGGTYVTVDPLHGAAVDVEIPGSCRNADGTDCTLIHVTRDKCR